MKKDLRSTFSFILFVFIIGLTTGKSQTSQEFWLAPPVITADHAGKTPIYLRITSGNVAAVVTISMPANAGFTPIIVNVPANSTLSENLSAYVTQLETPSNDLANNTGILIESTADITCYYELSPTNNPDIWALKGENGLGTEFYVPVQNIWPNGNYTPELPYTSFDIVATEDNTVVSIYPKTDLDYSHPALQAFTVFLDRGQTYSGSVGKFDIGILPSENPSGTVIVSNNNIAVSIKDDSVNPTGYGGCRDVMGDQLVPTDILGLEYIAQKGFLNGDDQVYVLATDNNTEVYIDGVYQTTLFGGEMYNYSLSEDVIFINCTNPVYVIQNTGFGCEVGMAILPPLNCAGSESVSFMRSTSERFGLNILIKDGNQGNFELNGDASIITASDFTVVPGNTDWVYAQLDWANNNTGTIPVGTAQKITNSTSVFALGLINGGNSSGCRFGYFSEFSASVIVDAGTNSTVCGNDTLQLVGDVSGGALEGFWSTSGTGTFIPDEFDLNANYIPSVNDEANGNVIITLESIGSCTPVTDQIIVSVTPSPTIDLGIDLDACANNPSVNLSAATTVATSALWYGGAGSFSPSNIGLNVSYTPTSTEISNGSIMLYANSAGMGTCNPVIDSITINFTPSPTVDAGANQSVCANNAEVLLNGSVTVGTGGTWSGGSGLFNPNQNALNVIYTPTAAEIANGSLNLTLSSTGNGDCNFESDQVTITFTSAPIVNAGSDDIYCSNNAAISLGGSISGATGGQWTGGLGAYDPNSTDLNAIYSPTAAELSLGSVTLTLESTGNGNCLAETDQVSYTFSPSPTIDAGLNQSICENNPDVSLNASINLSTGGQWSGGSGVFSPNQNVLNPVYTPTAAEIASGSMQLYITSTGNGICNAVTDSLTITFTPAPTANAGPDQEVCANNVNVNLNGSVIGATGGTWTGGSGTYNPSNTVPNPSYTPSAIEISNGTVSLTFTTTGNANCNAVSDDIEITISAAPIVSAGFDESLCSNNEIVNLNGSVSGASGAIWSGGLGIFDPGNTDLNSQYTPTSAEVSLGSMTLSLTSTGNGTCIAEEDQVTFTFTPSPVVEAGSDETVCGDQNTIPLTGSVSVASGGQWSTAGSGGFSPTNTTLNANYIASPIDITNGAVMIYLTSIGNGSCNAVMDSMLISFDPVPTVDAGVDLVSCENNVAVLLNGLVTGASGGIWSGGSGVFNPSSSSLAATYIPSPAEIVTGSLTLTLTTTGNGLCTAVSDQMNITINPAPIVSAGADLQSCANNPSVILDGNVQFASGGIWSGGNGSFSPSNTSLNAIYTPTADETNNGSMVLTLTSTGIGSCLAVNDQVQIIFTLAPVVNAGLDQSVCENNSTVNLIGSISGAGGGVWSGGIGTYSPDNSSLNVIYEPHPSELANGNLILTLSSTGNGTCNIESDDIEITFTPAPIVEAGSDITTCVDDLEVALNGNVTGATTTGSWSSSGNGFFTPNNLVLNPTYVVSSQDSINGGVTLFLSSTGNGNCFAVIDSMMINVFPVGIADAGSDVEVCANNSSVSLDGQISGAASSGVWSSNGNGSFVPNVTTLNADYIPSADDILNGTVTLTLTADACNIAVDNMIVTITPAPSVYAGEDQTVCITDLDVQLGGVVGGATSTGIWASNGTGTFVPDATTLNAIYMLSSADSLNQGVVLTLSSTSNGNCIAVEDTVNIFVFPTGTADAGSNQTVCGNDADVQLNGIVSGGADQGQWSSSGTGLFSPNDLALDAIYTPSAQDISNTSVTLTLSTLNSCNLASDQMQIDIDPAPIVTSYSDTTICGTNPIVDIVGNISNAGGGVWSTSGTGTFSSTTNLSTVYTASADDITLGSVLITLTSTSNGLCLEESASFNLSFSDGIYVSAGPDQEVCISSTNTVLAGVINNGTTSGVWSTNGDGTFSDDTDLNATYNFGANDFINGEVTLTLNSTNNGTCAQESDQMLIVFGNTVNVYAGPDLELCADNGPLQLDGIVSGGSTTGNWSTTGGGVFLPNETTLNAIYDPSESDSLSGSFSLILISTNNGGCLAGSDTTDYQLRPLPQIDAGGDQVVCSGSDSVFIQTVVENVDQLLWTTTGSGSFYPDNTSLQVVYLPSSTDQQVGAIDLMVSSIGSSPCQEASNEIHVTFADPFVATAGNDIITCATMLEIQLDGQVSGTTTGAWSSSGSGFFFPTEEVLNGQYFASQADSLLGSVWLVLSPTNASGCDVETDSLQLIIEPAPIANGGGDQIVCIESNEVQLNGSVSNADGGVWGTNGTGVFIPDPTQLDAMYQFSPQDQLEGEVILILSTTQSGVCSSVVDSILIELSNPLSAAFSWNGHCVENNIQFTDETVVNNGFIEGFEWNFGDGNSSLVQSPSNIFLSVGTFDVSLVVYSNMGCNDSITQQIIVYDNPMSSFDWEETENQFEVQFVDQSVGGGQNFWDFGDNFGESEDINPLYVYIEEGNYSVTQIVYNEQNCVDSTSQVITVSDPDVYAPTTPEAFSPNGDGVNDVFFVRGGPFTELNLKIYDGWGELIFESNSIDEGWDGNARGDLVQVGVYVYVVQATTTSGKQYEIQGKVTVIK